VEAASYLSICERRRRPGGGRVAVTGLSASAR